MTTESFASAEEVSLNGSAASTGNAVTSKITAAISTESTFLFNAFFITVYSLSILAYRSRQELNSIVELYHFIRAVSNIFKQNAYKRTYKKPFERKFHA